MARRQLHVNRTVSRFAAFALAAATAGAADGCLGTPSVVQPAPAHFNDNHVTGKPSGPETSASATPAPGGEAGGGTGGAAQTAAGRIEAWKAEMDAPLASSVTTTQVGRFVIAEGHRSGAVATDEGLLADGQLADGDIMDLGADEASRDIDGDGRVDLLTTVSFLVPGEDVETSVSELVFILDRADGPKLVEVQKPEGSIDRVSWAEHQGRPALVVLLRSGGLKHVKLAWDGTAVAQVAPPRPWPGPGQVLVCTVLDETEKAAGARRVSRLELRVRDGRVIEATGSGTLASGLAWTGDLKRSGQRVVEMRWIDLPMRIRQLETDIPEDDEVLQVLFLGASMRLKGAGAGSDTGQCEVEEKAGSRGQARP